MLKAQVDLNVPCPHTQDFQPCMAPGCTTEGKDFLQTQPYGKKRKKKESKVEAVTGLFEAFPPLILFLHKFNLNGCTITKVTYYENIP